MRKIMLPIVKRFGIRAVAALSALIFFSLPASADTVNFTVTGMPYGWTTDQTWTFSIQQNPAPDVVGPDFFEFNDVMVSMDGEAPVAYFMEFTDTGGTDNAGWLGFQCNPWYACSWDIAAGMTVDGTFFSGSTSDPTFLMGDFSSGSANCNVQITKTPEAPTGLLVLLGIVFGCFSFYGRTQRLRRDQTNPDFYLP